MAIFDLYSKRTKAAKEETSDVFTYDDLPQKLRIQIVQIWDDAIGNNEDYHNSYMQGDTKGAFEFIAKTLRREYGVHNLVPSSYDGRTNFRTELREFLQSDQNVLTYLDVIELSFRVIDRICRKWSSKFAGAAHDAIEELNVRLKEAGVGYRYTEGTIIKIDEELLHGEVVKPALTILRAKHFDGAREEYLSAFSHYREGKNKEALNDCLKAFESAMKAICDKRGWDYDKNSTASKLIQILIDNGLMPKFWQNSMSNLRTLLESSVPTGRNKLSGHGQGTEKISVPDHVASYMLHMTGSCIVFLDNAEKALP